MLPLPVQAGKHSWRRIAAENSSRQKPGRTSGFVQQKAWQSGTHRKGRSNS